MKLTTTRQLDPRLRRLVHSTANPARLRGDLDRAFVNTAGPELEAGEEVAAELLTKRVLVKARQGSLPTDFVTMYNPVEVAHGIYALDVPLIELNDLAVNSAVEYVESGSALYPELSSSVPEVRADLVVNPEDGAPGASGKGVLVGIIDIGLDFTLADFVNANGTTRVAFLWDQGLLPQAGESSPQPYNYGVEYGRSTIDAALSDPNPFSLVRHTPGAGSHGTHVAGIAVGNGMSGDAAFPPGSFVGVAPDATIVFVQPAPGGNLGSFTDSVRVAEAIRYCYDKADELGLPCVINMSLGQNGGSHDGESVVERAIDALLAQPGRAMVLAAGNEHIWRGHSAGKIGAGQQHTLRWKVGGGLPLPGGAVLPFGAGDFTPNEMEIWYSSRDRLRVRVVDPDGEVTPWVNAGETEFHTFASGDEAFVDSERFTILNGDARIYIELGPAGAGDVLLTGEWQVELDGSEINDGAFDAWIERDARRPENNFADQSFFVGTDFDGHMTLGTPATTRRGIAVANYEHQTEVPSNSSSRGRTRDGRPKPEVAAPGTNIFSSHSLGGRTDADGQVLPMRVSMSGTSMAAPHVAGIIALLLERQPDLSAEQLKKILIASTRVPIGVTPFDDAWGYGKVDARQAFDLIA